MYEIGGIESVGALPDDPTFDQRTKKYVIASYKKICVEFGIDPSSDFCFTYGQNHGLGYVYISYSDGRPLRPKEVEIPPADLSNPSSQRFSDEGGSEDAGNRIDFMRNDQGSDKQFEYFVPNYAQGITRPGLARINQSIEAYCYCILGAQAKTRSTIHGFSGGAIETQREFLDHIKDSIVRKNISDSIQRYQEAIADTRTRLDFLLWQKEYGSCHHAWS